MYAPADSVPSSQPALMRFLVRSWEYRRPRLWVGVRERTAARHPDVPVRTRATHHPHDRAHRRPSPAVLHHRDHVGINDKVSVWTAIATLLVGGWELSLGLWMVGKGFKPSPIIAAANTTDTEQTLVPVG
jgi:hypothetical protein